MGSAENGGGQHPAPEGRKIGTPPPPLDVFDTFPYHANFGVGNLSLDLVLQGHLAKHYGIHYTILKNF